MINIKEKKDCCGCTACVSICGHNSISMEVDAEGFKYPKVNLSSCVNCGLCESVCPMLHPESDQNVIEVIAAKNNNPIVRKESSSGGIFYLLAQDVIAQGGIVVGCAMNENLQAVHIVCTSTDELVRLRSSKYVQSDVEGIYSHVRKVLRSGKIVLFSGTPCQVAALRRYLMKPFDNLICVDVLCHGVPSPKLFREYKEMVESKFKSKATFVSFRSKKKEWKRLYINFQFENGKEYFKSATFDPYMQLFLSNMSQRNSCFHCPFTTTNRQGDISLGDFWGIGRFNPAIDDNKGISMILINSEVGEALYNNIKHRLYGFDCSIQQAIAGNKVLVENIPGEDKRNQFYKMYVTQGLFKSLEYFTIYYPSWKQYYINLMRCILDFVRKILHRGY